MTLDQAIELALIKIDSEKSDFDSRIFWSSADVAQKKIACYGKHIQKTLEVTTTSDTAYTLTMPTDLFQFVNLEEVGSLEQVNYYWKDNQHIIIEDTGIFKLNYYALPTTIDVETLGTHEFEVSKETQVAIPFYIAYECTKTDDIQLAQQMLNEWNAYLSLFKDTPKPKETKIINHYALKGR